MKDRIQSSRFKGSRVQEFKSQPLNSETLKPLNSETLKPLNSETLKPLKEGWRWVRLGEVCEIIKGKKPTLYDEKIKEDYLPYLTAEFLRFGAKPKYCSIYDKNSVRVTKEDIIIIADGSNSGEVFFGYEGIIASTMGKLKIMNELAIKDYVYFFIKMNFKELNVPKRGSAIPHLEKEIFYNLLLPLPPIEEQKRIVAKLQELMQEVERARTACEKQLEAAKALPAAYLREVFESEEAKKWERKILAEVLEIIESGSRPKGGVFEIKEGIPSIGAEHLNSFGGFNFDNIRFIPKEFYEGMNKGKIQKGDVLVVKDGATTGKVSFVGDSFPYAHAAINEHVFRLRVKEPLEQEFLFWFLYSPSGQEQIQQEFHGSAQGGINQKFVNSVCIPIPSLSEQRRIVSYLKQKMAEVEKLRNAIEKQLEAINALPQAILRKAFRGEL